MCVWRGGACLRKGSPAAAAAQPSTHQESSQKWSTARRRYWQALSSRLRLGSRPGQERSAGRRYAQAHNIQGVGLGLGPVEQEKASASLLKLTPQPTRAHPLCATRFLDLTSGRCCCGRGAGWGVGLCMMNPMLPPRRASGCWRLQQPKPQAQPLHCQRLFPAWRQPPAMIN